MNQPTRDNAEYLCSNRQPANDDYNFEDTDSGCRSLHHNYMFDKVTIEHKTKC